MRCARHVAGMGMRNVRVYRTFVVNPDGNGPLERPISRREDNIKMSIGAIAWGGMDWIHLTQDKD
jgi:hypothetical protein